MPIHGSFNGPIPAPGSSRGGDAPAHLCAQCRTPLGKSSIPCKNEPKDQS
jgi:hypothetical protein